VSEHLLFLTGSLAETSLYRVLESLGETDFTWEVRNLGVKVAALMTADTIRRRLTDTGHAGRVVIPGRVRGDLEMLNSHFGVTFERGPEELRDLPAWLGQGGHPVDLSQQDVLIFAEIVDAPQLAPEKILARAREYQGDGADVIDLGCLPGQPFPHLAESVSLLKSEGFQVSVDTPSNEELLTGGRAGADYLLSLTEDNLWIADQVAATPILIPKTSGDLESLQRAWETLQAKGVNALVDPILEPIHFGFTDSIVRYHEIRRRLPEAEMMVGVGNLTELTEADTCGINALLFGMISELRASAVLTTQVSPHCRSAVREADLARRIMYRAREDNSLPKQLHGGLTGLHERKPFPYDSREIHEAAEAVKDANFRIQVNADGIHVYNRHIHRISSDPFDLYPQLSVENDAGHAFYLGVELARAEIALQLGKRYTQDQPLNWGAALPAVEEDLEHYTKVATTKKQKRVKE
jgi:dihydropteroate synthase-like protein